MDEREAEGDGISNALDRGDGEAVTAPDDLAVVETRSEIRSLMDRVRQMSSQFRASRANRSNRLLLRPQRTLPTRC